MASPMDVEPDSEGGVDLNTLRVVLPGSEADGAGGGGEGEGGYAVGGEVEGDGEEDVTVAELAEVITDGAAWVSVPIIGEEEEHVCLVCEKRGFAFIKIKTLADCQLGRILLARQLNPKRGGRFEYTSASAVIKECRKERVYSDELQEDVWTEMAMLQYLTAARHAHLQAFGGVLEDDRSLYLLLEYYGGGDLFAAASDGGMMAEVSAARYLSQLMEAVQTMHELGVAHRDLSLENVMLTAAGDVKVIDFGMATLLRRREDGSVLPCKPGHVGKYLYMSPEVYACKPYDARANDVWCCGVILFMLLTAAPPFEAAHRRCRRFALHSAGGIVDVLRLWRYQDLLSPEVVDLLNGMLAVHPEERLTPDDVLAHPWLASMAVLAKDV
eukprot:PLAT8349.1.p1 GENE.PLAT8349.1~~PLAT8349.1.p1  ORF type:complete len:423 (-),score=150.86 PLAT8349.1:263-1414(-)